MSDYSLVEISKYIGGELYGSDKLVSGFSIDSRTMANNDVFICIKGEKYDGHNFIHDILSSAACVVISRDINNIDFSKKSYIKVNDTFQALQKMSEYVRSQSKAKFIAITGSNGKTTVKEMLAHILSDYDITYTKGNFNNHIGVPLTLLSVNRKDKFVILEVGSNKPGEIKPLSKLIKPDIAAVTNIGYAHIEGFKSLKNTAYEKYSIYESLTKDGVAVINNESKYTHVIENKNKIYFGYKKSIYKKLNMVLKNIFGTTDFFDIKKINNNTIEISHNKISATIKMKLHGEHNFMNVACASSIAVSLGIPLAHIKYKIESFIAVSSRLKLHELDNNINIIDDCYNANPSSFKAALEYLSKVEGTKIVLMGDMVELGKDSNFFHKEIGEYAKKLNIDKFISLGVDSKLASDVFSQDGKHFTDQNSLKSYLNNNIESNSYILIKGSRSAQLEKYVDYLKSRSN